MRHPRLKTGVGFPERTRAALDACSLEFFESLVIAVIELRLRRFGQRVESFSLGMSASNRKFW